MKKILAFMLVTFSMSHAYSYVVALGGGGLGQDFDFSKTMLTTMVDDVCLKDADKILAGTKVDTKDQNKKYMKMDKALAKDMYVPKNKRDEIISIIKETEKSAHKILKGSGTAETKKEKVNALCTEKLKPVVDTVIESMEEQYKKKQGQ